MKIAAAASIGCLLAVLFQLQTPTSAGIIAILSLQNTLVSNTVLVLHLYAAQSVHPALLVNELLLLLTGTSCGILMNLYMPGNSAKIRRAQSELEQIFRNTFHRIARDIVMDKQLACTFFDLSDLDLILKKLEKEAHENQGNTLLSDEQYFVKYVEMRKNQKLVVEKLCQNIRLLHDVPIQAHAISHFIEDVSIKFHESNNTQELMQKLTEMQTSMQKEPLPVTRTEFENRAVLYRILYDLEELITIKKRSKLLSIVAVLTAPIWEQFLFHTIPEFSFRFRCFQNHKRFFQPDDILLHEFCIISSAHNLQICNSRFL